MSQITLKGLRDLGRRHGGGGGRGRRGWRGGGPWWGGAYPYYDAPIVFVDPIDPSSDEAIARDQEELEKAKVRLIVATVKEELKKDKGLGQGQFSFRGHFVDVLGPGSREGDIDREAADGELVDEFVPAQQALLWRQQAGLVGLSDASGEVSAPTSALRSKAALVGALTVLAGAALGYAVGNKLCGNR